MLICDDLMKQLYDTIFYKEKRIAEILFVHLDNYLLFYIHSNQNVNLLLCFYAIFDRPFSYYCLGITYYVYVNF